jgi:Protein of unknown function (DUF4238)
MGTGSRPRRHHYVPEAYLAAFTPQQRKDDRLFVYDTQRDLLLHDQLPKNVGHERDYYRLEDVEGDGDPFVVEKMLSRLESEAIEVIKTIEESANWPTDPVAGARLLEFMAAQALRGPAVRGFLESIAPRVFRGIAGNPDALREACLADGFDPDDEDLAKLAAKFESDAIRATPGRDLLVKTPLSSIPRTMTWLQERYWSLVLTNDDLPLVVSDTPFTISWASAAAKAAMPDKYPALALQGTIVAFPLTRRIGLVGVFDRATPRNFDHRVAGLFNTYTVMNAGGFIAAPSKGAIHFCSPNGSRADFDDFRAINKARLRRRRRCNGGGSAE